MIELTERFLSDTGGWQALQQARSMQRAGRVSEAAYSPPFLRGRVREGETEYQSGLEIRSRSDVENLCRCRESQQWGKICAHSLAVGMAVLKQSAPAPSAPPQKAATPPEDGYHFTAASPANVRLSLVLPPNLETAWDRGQIAVAVEAEQGTRRGPLEGLQPGSYSVEEGDLRLIAALRELNAGRLAGFLSLPQQSFLQLLEAATGHPRVSVARREVMQIRAERPLLVCRESPAGALEMTVQLPPHQKLLKAPAGVWLLAPGTLAHLSRDIPPAYRAIFENSVKLDTEAAAQFRQSELPALARGFRIEGIEIPAAVHSGIVSGMESPLPQFELRLEGSLNHLAAQLNARYPHGSFPASETPPSDNRHSASEAGALHRLTAAGFAGPDAQGQFTLRTERNILRFFASDLPRLQRDWDVKFGDRFRRVTTAIERVTPRIKLSGTGEDWFEMGVEFTGGGQRISAEEVQRLLRSGQSHFRAKSGQITVLDADMLDDFSQVLAECQAEQRTPGIYRMPRIQSGYLAETLRRAPSWQVSGMLEPPPPPLDPDVVGDLRSILRPYQWEGVCALHARAITLGGAILADEMGLGKTLQALALIRAQRGEAPQPALVVAPSSLVFNWQREAARFTAELRVIAVHGPDRSSALAAMPEADLVVTSYPILQRDLERFAAVQFSSVFLDEAQHIKNPDTQNAKAATRLRARHRFVLTGTPVENSIRDIWSLMEFITPGYLGSRQDFREAYELPVQRDPSAPELDRFRRRIHPFLIRRLKSEVLHDLPEKTSQVIYYELTSKQASIYSMLAAKGRECLERLRSGNGPGGRMAALNLLLRLRQVCCDPNLVGDVCEESPVRRSGKFAAFQELVEEAIDGGHRLLVFSQFVKVLHELKIILDSGKLDYCYLDGATRDRPAEVDRFQSEGGPPVFLISLKAGGSGLNLTAADTVIHVDPWWNPAVEDQATDRVHRIGQKRSVTAYKLIGRGTVEEKILALQERKRTVTAAIVESEEPVMTGLTDDDLQELLA